MVQEFQGNRDGRRNGEDELRSAPVGRGTFSCPSWRPFLVYFYSSTEVNQYSNSIKFKPLFVKSCFLASAMQYSRMGWATIELSLNVSLVLRHALC